MPLAFRLIYLYLPLYAISHITVGIWGVINLMEGYGNDNPGANAHVR